MITACNIKKSVVESDKMIEGGKIHASDILGLKTGLYVYFIMESIEISL